MPPDVGFAVVGEAMVWNVDVALLVHPVVADQVLGLVKHVQLSVLVVVEVPWLHGLIHDVGKRLSGYIFTGIDHATFLAGVSSVELSVWKGIGPGVTALGVLFDHCGGIVFVPVGGEFWRGRASQGVQLSAPNVDAHLLNAFRAIVNRLVRRLA